jgi:hypothetical protein
VSGHFRGVKIINSTSHTANVVDLGGGPRNEKLQNAVAYYFHDTPQAGAMRRVVSVKFPDAMKDGDYRSIAGWTGPDVRAAEVKETPFPELLAPVDDLPPATMITDLHREGGELRVRGVAEDNGEITSVAVNGKPARIVSQQAGVADWEITLEAPEGVQLTATATDRAGNEELMPHKMNEGAR